MNKDLKAEIDAMARDLSECGVAQAQSGKTYFNPTRELCDKAAALLLRCKFALADHESALKLSIANTDEALGYAEVAKSALEQSERKPTGWLYWVKGVENSNVNLDENYRHGPQRPDKRESWIPLYAALASDGKGK